MKAAEHLFKNIFFKKGTDRKNIKNRKLELTQLEPKELQCTQVFKVPTIGMLDVMRRDPCTHSLQSEDMALC